MRVPNVVALALSITVAPQCRRLSDAELAGRELAAWRAQEYAAFSALPPCQLPPLGDTTTWTRVEHRDVLLPPAFVFDSLRRRGCSHGCLVWRRGHDEYAEVFGYWGFSSFSSDSISRKCRAQLQNRTVLVVARDSLDRYRAYAWYVDTAARWYTTLYEATGPRSDTSFLLRVLQTRIHDRR